MDRFCTPFPREELGLTFSLVFDFLEGVAIKMLVSSSPWKVRP